MRLSARGKKTDRMRGRQIVGHLEIGIVQTHIGITLAVYKLIQIAGVAFPRADQPGPVMRAGKASLCKTFRVDEAR